jgi:hypothetical protein
MAIAGKVGAVYVSDVDTAPVAFADKATTKDGANKRYQVTDPTCRYWPPGAAITVKKNAAPVTTGFTLERAGGVVVFDVALQGTDVILVSGTALTLVQAGGFFNWSVDGDGDDADATTFASGGWKEFVRMLIGWSGSAEAYWGDTRFFNSLGQIVVVKLFIDAGAAQSCMEGFANISGDKIEAPVDGVIQETVDFTGVGSLYLRL